MRSPEDVRMSPTRWATSTAAPTPPQAGLPAPAGERRARSGGTRPVRPILRVLVWTGAVAVSILLQWRWLTLHDDVRGSFGTLRVGEAGGLSPTDIFIHRPMVNRLLMSGLDHLSFGPVVFRERLTLSLAMVFAGFAAAGLARSLRAWTGDPAADLTGLATFAALAWAPDVTMLQPEWTAVLLSVGALALALGRPPDRVPGWDSARMWGAGLLLALAILQKYTTVTSALVAWGIILVVSRRRAWIVGCWTAVLTLGLFGLTVLQPHEWQWFREMPRLQKTNRLRWDVFGLATWRVAWTNPIVLLWPAASIYGFARTRRVMWLFGPVIAVLVILAGVVFQNAFFPYHYGALPVLMAGLGAVAAARWWQSTGRAPLAVILVAAGWLPIARWMGRHAFAWRLQHPPEQAVLATMVLAGIVAGGQVLRARSAAVTPRPRTWRLLLTAVGLALIISFPAWPQTPTAYSWLDTDRVSEVGRRAEMFDRGRQIRDAAGGAPVAYVTVQEGPYFVGLPTACSYPMAVFLYRSRLPQATDLTGFQETLSCLRDPRAQFLVLQPYAAAQRRAAPVVRTTIQQEFDCQHPVVRNSTFTLCPRPVTRWRSPTRARPRAGRLPATAGDDRRRGLPPAPGRRRTG